MIYNEDFKFTGQRVKLGKRNICRIYSKMTKKGVRYYYLSGFAHRPISQQDINDNIWLG